jgi:hypothetical protein
MDIELLWQRYQQQVEWSTDLVTENVKLSNDNLYLQRLLDISMIKLKLQGLLFIRNNIKVKDNIKLSELKYNIYKVSETFVTDILKNVFDSIILKNTVSMKKKKKKHRKHKKIINKYKQTNDDLILDVAIQEANLDRENKQLETKIDLFIETLNNNNKISSIVANIYAMKYTDDYISLAMYYSNTNELLLPVCFDKNTMNASIMNSSYGSYFSFRNPDVDLRLYYIASESVNNIRRCYYILYICNHNYIYYYHDNIEEASKKTTITFMKSKCPGFVMELDNDQLYINKETMYNSDRHLQFDIKLGSHYIKDLRVNLTPINHPDINRISVRLYVDIHCTLIPTKCSDMKSGGCKYFYHERLTQNICNLIRDENINNNKACTTFLCGYLCNCK